MSRYDAIPDALVTADLGEGVGVQPVVDWSVSRQMSGGGLPGQARGASGMSVGSGSVTVDSPAGRSPWTPGPIRPGGRVALDARADTLAPMSPVARMVARDVSGTASSRSLSVTIQDDIEALKAPQSFMVPPEFVGAPLDAAGVIAVLAARAGYHVVPPPVASALVAFPLVGTPMPTLGLRGNVTRGENLRYLGDFDGLGVIGPPAPVYGFTSVELRATQAQQVPLSQPVFATVDFGVSIYVEGDTSGGSHTWLTVRPGGLRVTANAFQFFIAVQGVTGGWANIPRPSSLAQGWYRVQYQTEWVGPFSGTVASGARARARFGASGAWSAWATVSGSFDTAAPGWQGVGVSLGVGAIRGYQTHTDDDPAVWMTPTAYVEPSGSILAAALPAPAQSAWETMQEIARSTLGWVGINPDGMLVYRRRDSLRSRASVETIISEVSLEDVPWRISSDDVADRVEVTYRPPTVLTAAGSAGPAHTMWESTELIGIPPGRPAVIDAQIQGAIGRPSPRWLPVWDATWPGAEWSRWNAFPSPDGSDTTQPPDNALAFDTQMLSSDRVRITITNRMTYPLWVTQLTLRAETAARAGEPLTVSRGAPSDVARSPLTYDLGTWVQDDATAREILDWLTGTTSEPLPTLERVRVVPDAARQLGQIVKVEDRTTSLVAKALITGISMAGSDGSLTQHLDLAILWVTEEDVMRYVGPKPALSTELDIANFLTTTLGAGATEADLAAWLPTGVI